MRIPHARLALAFFVPLFACAIGQAESPASSVSQATDEKEATAAPVQLSEYPSAPHEDRQGNHWFRGAFAGVTRYDGEEFKTFTTQDGLASDGMRGMLEDEDGTLWFATREGLCKYDGESFTTLTEYEGTQLTTRTFNESGDHRELWDVMRDRHGTLWIATMAGVFRHNGKAFVQFPMPVISTKERSEFAPAMVYDIFEDKDGNLWFGTDGAGAIRYDGTNFTVYTAAKNGLCSDRVCVVSQDPRGHMWFGTSDGGVSRFDGKSFETFLRSKEHSIHTGWGRFMSIHRDRAGAMWFGVASKGGGVHRYDGEDFRYFGNDDGLTGGGVPSISEDRAGNLWLGTTSGVFRFDGKRFLNFTKNGEPFPREFDDWQAEVIPLPPGFAPELPTGVESLRFAPNWRDPSADGFWTYAFAMWIDEPTPDTARIEALMESYYEGLMSAVISGDREKLGDDLAQITVEPTSPNQFELQMHLINAFGDNEPVNLRGLIETVAESSERSVLRIRVSSQPEAHAIWSQLGRVVARIQKP